MTVGVHYQTNYNLQELFILILFICFIIMHLHFQLMVTVISGDSYYRNICSVCWV